MVTVYNIINQGFSNYGWRNLFQHGGVQVHVKKL